MSESSGVGTKGRNGVTPFKGHGQQRHCFRNNDSQMFLLQASPLQIIAPKKYTNKIESILIFQNSFGSI